MPKPESGDHRGLLGEPPTEVLVTVLRGPRDPRTPARIADIPLPSARTIIAVVVLAVAIAIAALVADASLGGGSGSERREASRARAGGPAGVVAAYGYPRRCLTVTIAPHDPSFARADFDHAAACGRYTGYATAIFHRVDSVWMPALDAVTYSCPVHSLPTRVQADLGVCS